MLQSNSTPARTSILTRRSLLQLALAVVAAGLVLGLPFLVLSPLQAGNLVKHASYWILAGSFVAFATLWLRLLFSTNADGSWLARLKRHRWGLLLVIGAAVFFQLHEPRSFKILYDEFVISAVARNYHFEREASAPGRAHYLSGGLYTMNHFVDKRPTFFPFLLSGIHDLTGYRTENVFFFNAVLAACLLGLVYALCARYGGAAFGCFGVVLLASLPLLAQNATGGGYELLNLCMILALLFAGARYLRLPGAQGLGLLLLTAILLAQTRYESILYTLVVPLLALLKWSRERQVTLSWFAVLSPLLLLPALLHSRVFFSNRGFYQTAEGQAFFSFNDLLANLGHAVFFLFDFSRDIPNSILLSLTGVLGLLFAVIYFLKYARETLRQHHLEPTLLAILVVLLANTVLALSNFWGQWTDPMAMRFSLPLHLAFVLAAGLAAREFCRGRDLPALVPALTGGLALLFVLPAFARHTVSNQLHTAREFHWTVNQLQDAYPRDKTLIVAASSLGFVLEGYASVPSFWARLPGHAEKFNDLRSLGLYEHILVLDRLQVDPETTALDIITGNALPERFVREPIAEVPLRPNARARLSRLVRVDPPNADEDEPLPLTDQRVDEQYLAMVRQATEAQREDVGEPPFTGPDAADQMQLYLLSRLP